MERQRRSRSRREDREKQDIVDEAGPSPPLFACRPPTTCVDKLLSLLLGSFPQKENTFHITYRPHSIVDLLLWFQACIMSSWAHPVSTGFTVQTWFGLWTELPELVQVGSAYVMVTELSQTVSSSSGSGKRGSELNWTELQQHYPQGHTLRPKCCDLCIS